MNATPETVALAPGKPDYNQRLQHFSMIPYSPTSEEAYFIRRVHSHQLGARQRQADLCPLIGRHFYVAVLNSATVKDLKLVIKKKVNDMEESGMGHRYISWKHVWANFYLLHHNEKLLNDDSALEDYGVRNNSQVQFDETPKASFLSRSNQKIVSKKL